MNVSCVVLTRNAGLDAGAMTTALGRQSLQPFELLVFDSASSDDTVREYTSAGASVHNVKPSEFAHAKTRNMALSVARGDIVVFLTQDAIPANPTLLEELTRPLVEGSAIGSFGRHLPRSNASPLERFARETNYPRSSRLISRSDIGSRGVRAFFFSNSCSAILREELLRLEGFPSGTVMNEDMLFAALALRSGHRLAYVAEATVWHSHNLSAAATFRRYFDIGTVFADAAGELSTSRTGREGIEYVRSLLAFLLRSGNSHWIPMAILESALKAIGFWIGKRYAYLPLAIRTRLSQYPDYWRRTST